MAKGLTPFPKTGKAASSTAKKSASGTKQTTPPKSLNTVSEGYIKAFKQQSAEKAKSTLMTLQKGSRIKGVLKDVLSEGYTALKKSETLRAQVKAKNLESTVQHKRLESAASNIMGWVELSLESMESESKEYSAEVKALVKSAHAEVSKLTGYK